MNHLNNAIPKVQLIQSVFGKERFLFVVFIEEILAVNWGKGELTQV